MLALRIAVNLSTANPVGLTEDVYRLSKAGMSYVKTKKYDKERVDLDVDPKTGFRLKKTEMTPEQDIARVNPSVHNFDKNTKNNCMLCTATYDLRRRGYDVTAKKALYGYKSEDINTWYPKAKIKKITGLNEEGKPSRSAMIKQLKEELVKQGDGARGNLMIKWARMRGGHSVAYEISNGELRLIDAQVNRIHTKPEKLLYRSSNVIEYARLDNVDFNAKTIKEVAE